MSDTLGRLIERNLFEVFGQRDSVQRAAAIAELYTADCKFFEAEERSPAVKRSTRRSRVFSRMLLDSCFAQQDLRRSITILAVCGGSLGPGAAPPVVTGTDIALFEHGRIRALYTFIDESATI